MDYIVTKNFIERVTGKNIAAGSTYTCSDDKRAAFLIEHGYIAEMKAEPEAEPKKAEKAAKPQKAPAKRTAKSKKA